MSNINIGQIIMFAIGFVFMGVGFSMLPTVLAACDAILAYAYTSNVSITDSTYTGLTSMTGLTPLLMVLGYVSVAVISGFMGIKIGRHEASARLNVAGILLLGIALVFFAVGLYVFPIALDGISATLHNGGGGISASYTGFSNFLLLSPMLMLLGFVTGTVVLGFFGIKLSSTSEM